MDANHAAELARISGAMLDALKEAHAMAGRGELGADFRDLLHHVHDLHDLAVEALGTRPEARELVRMLSAEVGAKLVKLEALLDGDAPVTLQ